MPTYTYKCPECDYTFDMYHSIMDDSEKICLECGYVAQRMIGGGTSISIKGEKAGRSGATPSTATPRFT